MLFYNNNMSLRYFNILRILIRNSGSFNTIIQYLIMRNFLNKSCAALSKTRIKVVHKNASQCYHKVERYFVESFSNNKIFSQNFKKLPSQFASLLC